MASAAHPFQEGIPLGTAVVAHPLPQPSQAPIPFVCSFLPVWPSSQRPWPPPCNVRDSSVFWTPQLGLGECGITRVSRGHRACPGERLCTGHGPSQWALLEVVVNGLPLWNGAQLAIDTNGLVCETNRLSAGCTATTDGKHWTLPEPRKPEDSPNTFLCGFATTKARDAPVAFGQRSRGLAQPVARQAGVRCSQSLRAVGPRGAHTRRRGWSHPFHERRDG